MAKLVIDSLPTTAEVEVFTRKVRHLMSRMRVEGVDAATIAHWANVNRKARELRAEMQLAMKRHPLHAAKAAAEPAPAMKRRE